MMTHGLLDAFKNLEKDIYYLGYSVSTCSYVNWGAAGGQNNFNAFKYCLQAMK